MTGKRPKILVYGYGNPGRQDDALGIRLAEEVEKWSTDHHMGNVTTDTNYQLNLEDAANIAAYDIVIFADASREEIDEFCLDPLIPSEKSEFTMHAVSPAYVLHLCMQMFHRKPEAYLLHLRGYDWEFMEEMTGKAKTNLDKAFGYIKAFILKVSKI